MSWNPRTWWKGSSSKEVETPQPQTPVEPVPMPTTVPVPTDFVMPALELVQVPAAEAVPVTTADRSAAPAAVQVAPLVPGKIGPVTLRPTFQNDRDALPIAPDSTGTKLKQIQLDSTPIRQASLLVQAIIEERRAGPLPAVWRNFLRVGWKPRSKKRAIAKIAALAGGLFLVGPLAGLAVPPAILASRIWDVRRIRGGPALRSNRKAVPGSRIDRVTALVRRTERETPQKVSGLPWELRSLWNRSSWRLHRLVDSYNRRVEVVSEVLGDATRADDERAAAVTMGEMLSLEYVRLIGIQRDLMDLYGTYGPKSIRPLEDLMQYDHVIAEADLFGTRAGCLAPINWLLLPDGQFYRRFMLAQHQRDLEILEGFHDAETDPLEAKLEELERTAPQERVPPDADD